ncbi:MAG: GNAT family N-acetyltransferase [Ruminococcaceae bacterium]|nr:GNAT family N-acetyltransferase [Oscillospiraceae bacterium]
MNVYESCPKFENGDFLIRRTEKSDRDDLLKVYSDIKAVPFFNGDNCHGDDFHYTTSERMEQALDFWEQSYRGGWFVRFSVINKADNTVVGTVELFNRGVTEDFYSGYGILRLDLRSDYEKESVILNILSLIIPPAYGLFGCESIATKAVKEAVERISALEKYGFKKNDNKLIGEDGTEYSDYFSISQAVNDGSGKVLL